MPDYEKLPARANAGLVHVVVGDSARRAAGSGIPIPN